MTAIAAALQPSTTSSPETDMGQACVAGLKASSIARAIGATGTPAFLINGSLVLGAYPFEAFQQGFDSILATTPPKSSGPRP